MTSERGIRTTKPTLAILLTTALVQIVIALVSGSVCAARRHDPQHRRRHDQHPAVDRVRARPARQQPHLPLRLPPCGGPRRHLHPAHDRRIRRLDRSGVDPTPARPNSRCSTPGGSSSRASSAWVGNEFAAILRIRTGRRIGSAALVADGYHARTDTLASFAVIVAVIGTWLGLPILDPLIGLLITGLILWILKTTTVQVVRRLMDGVAPDTLDGIERAALAVDGVHDVGTVRARWSGHRLLADLTISVEGHRTLIEAHDIGEQVRHRLLHDIPHLEDAWIHTNPAGPSDDHHHLTAHHRSGAEGTPDER